MTHAKTILSLTVLLSAPACGEMATGPNNSADTRPQLVVMGELPPDPCIGCDGVWIGYSYSECLTSLLDDIDEDGFRDTCEQRLAEFLRPYMIMSDNDPTRGREPYWAVTSPQSGRARLFWAFAYYYDGGVVDTPGCELDGPASACAGHPGDSEYIVVDADYDALTEHWQLERVYYSQHGNGVLYGRNEIDYHGPEYAYPTVYVAWGKHAGYKSDYECDNALLDIEECYSDHPVRASYLAFHNLGSSQHNLLDCVESEGQYSSSDREECFWTGNVFAGWTGLYSETSPYGPMLSSYGF